MDAQCPYALYLARLSTNSRRSIQAQLEGIAVVMGWSLVDLPAKLACVDYAQALSIQNTLLREGFAPRSINRAMMAIRGVVKAAVITNQVDQQHYLNLQSVPKVKHGQHAGTPLTVHQVRKLFRLLAQNRIKVGWSVDKTRKLTISLGCLIMLPALLAMANPGGPTTAVLIMAVILFGFQTSIGNVQTLPSDLYGKKTVGTLAGFSGMAAKLAVVGLTSLVPILTADGNYTTVFVIGASLAVVAMLAVWLLIPKIEPLKKL